LTTGALAGLPRVGAYIVQPWTGASVVDFSPSHSPEGLEGTWEGVYLPGFAVLLPHEIYSLTGFNDRVYVSLRGTGGRFEGNGEFTGRGPASSAKKDPLILRIAPLTHLALSQLNFVEGVLLNGPTVQGEIEVKAPPLLADFTAPVTFHLTQNGVE